MTKTSAFRKDPDPAVLLAQAGWLRVLDDIHGGLCHDLNGRVSSLDGLVQILLMDGEQDASVVPFIEGETARLAATTRIMRGLAGRMGGTSEALQAADVVADVAALHRKHQGLDLMETHVSVAEGLPPFRASGPRLLRVLLVVLSHAGLAARDVDVRALELAAEGEGDSLVFRISWHGDAVWDPAALRLAAPYLEGVLRLDGGTLALESGSARVSLPAMVRAGA